MQMLVIKNTANNTICFVRELHTLHKHQSMGSHLKLYHEAFYFHQYFHFILQLICQLICFYTCNFYNLNILLCHMIYRIHTQNY